MTISIFKVKNDQLKNKFRYWNTLTSLFSLVVSCFFWAFHSVPFIANMVDFDYKNCTRVEDVSLPFALLILLALAILMFASIVLFGSVFSYLLGIPKEEANHVIFRFKYPLKWLKH